MTPNLTWSQMARDFIQTCLEWPETWRGLVSNSLRLGGDLPQMTPNMMWTCLKWLEASLGLVISNLRLNLDLAWKAWICLYVSKKFPFWMRFNIFLNTHPGFLEQVQVLSHSRQVHVDSWMNQDFTSMTSLKLLGFSPEDLQPLILTGPACCSPAAAGSPGPWCCCAGPRGSGWTPSSQWYGGPGRRRGASAACHRPCQWTAAGSEARSPCSRGATRRERTQLWLNPHVLSKKKKKASTCMLLKQM